MDTYCSKEQWDVDTYCLRDVDTYCFKGQWDVDTYCLRDVGMWIFTVLMAL